LAKRLGKHQSFVAKIETRQRRLDIVEFIVVARALDIDPASLLNSIIAELKSPVVF
jgi:transcriptional regulator with XRE-family HTH domain